MDKRWRAEPGETFWALGNTGDSIDAVQYHDNRDELADSLYNSGNYFNLKSSALYYAEKAFFRCLKEGYSIHDIEFKTIKM